MVAIINWNVIKMTDLTKWICVSIVVSLAIIITSSSAEIPQFFKLPPSNIFISPIDLEKSRSATKSFTILVTPGNSTVEVSASLLTSDNNNQNKLIKLSSIVMKTSHRSRTPTFHIVNRKTMPANTTNRFLGKLETVDKIILQFKNTDLLLDKTIHILLKNPIGVFTSPPIKILKKVLNHFPLVHHQTVMFYKGNIGQVQCILPNSRPSPPKVQFLFKNATISGIHSREDKYQIVYLNSASFVSAVLLISELDKQDEGVYTCTASLEGIKRVRKSEKLTRLKVTYPKTEIKSHFMFSSHDFSTRLSNGTRIIDTTEGENLTLYCLFESAPIQDIVWYIHGGRPDKYRLYPRFGVIKIGKVTAAEHRITLSCSSGDSPAKIFSLRVKLLPKLVSVPSRIQLRQDQSFGSRKVVLTCGDIAKPTSSQPNVNKNNKNIELTKKAKYRWIHNAQFISGPHYIMKANTLVLRNHTAQYSGIYQCIDSNNVWSVSPSIVRISDDSDRSTRRPANSTPAKVIRIVTAPRIITHLSCTWPGSQASRSSYTVQWLYGDKIINANQQSEYILFPKKNKTQEILSVLNPGVKDAGLYTCLVYRFDSLIHVSKFQLVVIRNSSKNSSKSARIGVSPGTPNTPLLPLRRLVSKPEVERVGKMLLGVLIGWRILDSDDKETESDVEHCRVEYERKRAGDPAAKWTGKGTMVPQRSKDNKLVLLGDGKDDEVLGRNYETRFRIVPVLRSLSNLLQPPKRFKRSSFQNNQSNILVLSPQISSNQIQDSIKSEWSVPINFTHLLDCSISLEETPIFDVENSILTLNWRHTCYQAYQSKIRQSYTRNHQQPMKYPNHQIQVVYSILYRQLALANQNDNDVDARLSLILGGSGPVHRSESNERLLLIGSNENANQLYDESVFFNMTALTKDRNYSIGIYGEVRLPKSSSYFLPLSNTISIATSPIKSRSTTTLIPPGQSSSNYNRVLFLVLGSLAGVLFVVLAVMLALCIGYLIKKKLFKSSNRSSSFRHTNFPAVDLSGSAYSWLAAKNHNGVINQHHQQQQQPFLYHSPPPPPPPPLSNNNKYQIDMPPPSSPLLLQQAPHTIGTLQHRRIHSQNGLPAGFYPNLGTLPRRPPASNQGTLLRSSDQSHNTGTIATRIGNAGLNGNCGTLSKKQFMCATNNSHNKYSPALTLPQPPNYEPNLHNKDDDHYENELHTKHPILSNHTSTLLLGSGLSNKTARYSPLGNNHNYINSNRISSPWLLGNSSNSASGRNDSSPLLLQTHQQHHSNINISPPHSPMLNDSYHGNDPTDDVAMCDVGHDSMITSSRTISQDNWMMTSNHHAANNPYADESPYCDPYYASSTSIGPQSTNQKLTTPLSFS